MSTDELGIERFERGLGGGLRDFCLDGSEQSPDPSVLRYRPRPEEGEEPMCQVRGGCWMFHADHPSATRSASSVTGRHSFLGFRVAWPL